MKFLNIAVVLSIVCFSLVRIQAQDDRQSSVQNQADSAPTATWLLRHALQEPNVNLEIVPQMVLQDNQNLTLEVVPLLRPFRFASSDGQYAAQNAEEIQAYQDMQMTFKYIDEPYLRKQLKLPEEEGLIVLEANQSGEGFRNGFRDGDIVLKVDDSSINTQYDFVIALAEDRGAQRKAVIRREGQPMELEIVLSKPQETAKSRYVIGVSVDEISDLVKVQLGIEGGVGVSSVTEDSAAAKAGIAVHDVIVRIDDKPLNTLEDLRQIVENSAGKAVHLEIVRAGEKLTADVQPTQMPVDESPDVNVNFDVRTIQDGLSLSRSIDPVNLRFDIVSNGESAKGSASDAELLNKISELQTKLDALIQLLEKK